MHSKKKKSLNSQKTRQSDANVVPVEEMAGEQCDVSGVHSENEEDERNMCEDEVGGIRICDIYIPPAPRPACTFDSTAPRLIITHIENTNFKSFAGTQVLGPFHKSFTSIVGPNGSGKSNVIDSMLFVFGYRAAKIRSKKISVLLHNSDEHQNVRSCTVTVNFQLIIDKPGEDFEMVPHSEIVISRTAFKDNSSYYTIDGKKVQFREVAKVLEKHGIDLDHNRFLILQGEVEQIAMMKPIAPNEHESGMLEFLEDIIGTNRFKEPLKTLFSRVEQLTEERTDLQARVKLVEKEMDALEEHKNIAIKFLQIENDIIAARNLVIQRYIFEHKKDITTQDEAMRKVEDTLASLQENMNTVHTEFKAKDHNLKQATKTLVEITAKKDQSKANFDKISHRDMTLQADILQASNKRKKMKMELKQEREKLLDLERVPEKNRKKIEELTGHEEQLGKDREREEAAKDKLIAGLAVETKGLKESKDELENTLIDLKKKVDETKSANDITKKELELYVSNEQKEQTKLEQIRKNYEHASQVVASRKPEIEELKTKIPDIEGQIENAQTEIKAVIEEDRVLSSQLRNSRSSVEETRSSMNATQSKGKVLDFLMKLKADGKLPGIYGRLGDLGAIDQKYDIAVSTACTGLEHVVVDTTETGQECIKLLKKHDIGRVNIIILDRQEYLRNYCSSQLQYPENVVRLYDMIRIPDERVKTAFYFCCRETLVANDLEQATRIGYGSHRYRVVTLKGEVIETSGTMSGGGRPSSGKMGRSVAAANVATPGQLDKMQRNLDQLEGRAREVRQRQETLQALLTRLPTQLRNMKMDLKKFAAEIQSAAKQEPVLKEQLARQEDKVRDAAPDPAQVKKLEAAVSKTQAAFDAASEAADKVGSKVKKLHNQIMEMTGGRVAAAQKKVDDLTTKCEKARQEMTKLKVAIKTSERNSKKSTEKIANIEVEIAESEKNMIEMREEIDSASKEGAKLLLEQETLSEEILQKEDEINELKVEVAEIVKRENEAKVSKLEVEDTLDKAKQSLEALRNKYKVASRELKALKLHKIPLSENLAELKVYTEEELLAKSVETLTFELTVEEEKRSDKRPNMAAIEEFQKKEAQYLKRMEDLEQMNARRTEMRNLYEDLRKKRLIEFLTGYNIITSKLKEMYQMITLGGDAELELVDSLDPFSEGVIFSVRPPKKSWKNIANLSGGEKTLSSLALVFALHYYKPSPLYVMDEIDAALDFKNVSIVGHYIKERTRNAQFIIISLRTNMFELSDRLIGIYKTHNATKSVAINPRCYGRLANHPQKTLSQAQNTQSDQGPPQTVSSQEENADGIMASLQQIPMNTPTQVPISSTSPGSGRQKNRRTDDAENEDRPRKKLSSRE